MNSELAFLERTSKKTTTKKFNSWKGCSNNNDETVLLAAATAFRTKEDRICSRYFVDAAAAAATTATNSKTRTNNPLHHQNHHSSAAPDEAYYRYACEKDNNNRPALLTKAYNRIIQNQKERSRSIVRSRQGVVSFLYKAIEYYKEDFEIVQVAINLLDRFLLRQYDHLVVLTMSHQKKKKSKKRRKKQTLTKSNFSSGFSLSIAGAGAPPSSGLLERAKKVQEFQDLGVTALLILDLAIKLFSPRSGRGARVQEVQHAMTRFREQGNEEDNANTSNGASNQPQPHSQPHSQPTTTTNPQSPQIQIDPHIYIGENFHSIQIMGADSCSMQELTLLQSYILESLEFYLHPPTTTTFLNHLLELIVPPPPCQQSEDGQNDDDDHDDNDDDDDDCVFGGKTTLKTPNSKQSSASMMSSSSIIPSSCSASKAATSSTSVHTTTATTTTTTPSFLPDLVSTSSQSLPTTTTGTSFDISTSNSTSTTTHNGSSSGSSRSTHVLRNTAESNVNKSQISTPLMIRDTTSSTTTTTTTNERNKMTSSTTSHTSFKSPPGGNDWIDTIKRHAQFQIDCCTQFDFFALQKPSIIATCALQNALQQQQVLLVQNQQEQQLDQLKMAEDRLTRIVNKLGISTHHVEFRSQLYHVWESNGPQGGGPETNMLGPTCLEWPTCTPVQQKIMAMMMMTTTNADSKWSSSSRQFLVTPPSLMNEIEISSRGNSASIGYTLLDQEQTRRSNRKGKIVKTADAKEEHPPRRSLRLLNKKRKMPCSART